MTSDLAALAKAHEILERHFTADRKSAPFYDNLARDIAAAISAQPGFVSVPVEPTQQSESVKAYAKTHGIAQGTLADWTRPAAAKVP